MKVKMRTIAAALALIALGWRTASAAGSGTATVESRPDAGPSMTLEWVEERVREDNPEVKAALAAARAARGMVLAAAAWPAPGLGLTYEGFPRPGFSPGDADRKSLDVTQEIPFPGKTYLARRSASADARRAEEEARRVVAEQVYLARQAYWDLVVAWESGAFLERAGAVLEKVVELSWRRNRFGQVGRMEQLMDPMARMERASLKVMVLDLAQERRAAGAALNALMGADPAAEPGEPAMPDTRDFEDAAWLETALDDSPAVAVALQDLKRMRARRDEARAGWLPDFMLQYSAGETKDGTRMGMAMAKVTVPLAWFWRPAGENRAAAAGVRASEEMLRQARLEVRRMASEDISWLAVVREQLVIFEGEILPQAERALELAVSGYESGSIGPADVLTAVRSYVSMNIERVMLTAQAGRSAAVLARLKGD